MLPPSAPPARQAFEKHGESSRQDPLQGLEEATDTHRAYQSRTAGQPCPPAAVHDRLAAAKALVWQGESELPQFPWEFPCHGAVLAIDLWSGTGGLLIALLALGVRVFALSVEQDPALREALAMIFPNLIHMEKVEDVAGDLFKGILTRRPFAAIVVGGGSPCQGNSLLNKSRRGLNDDRSQQPKELERIVKELSRVTDVPVYSFLENVHSAPAAVIQAYTSMLHAPPVEIDAA